MQLYWSDWTGAGTRPDPFQPAVVPLITAAGGQWATVDLRPVAQQNTANGRCLVGSSIAITPILPARFLLDTAADLDVLVPDAVVNFVNTQLSVSVPLQTFTWRKFFRRLFTIEGSGRWGTIVGDMKLKFGPLGGFDI